MCYNSDVKFLGGRSDLKKFITKSIAAVLLIAALLTASACGESENTKENPVMSAASAEAPSENSGDNITESSAETSEGSKDGPSKEESKTDPIDEKEKGELPALPDDDGSDVGYMSEGLLMYNGAAYEMFYGNKGLAQDYSAALSRIKKALGKDIKMYNIVVPTHCGVTLPQRIMDKYELPNQNQYINDIFDAYTEDIIGINTFDTLCHHRDEYLYFNTDHHWTGLASYYAYRDFCKAAGVEYLDISKLTEGEIEGYHGSLYSYFDPSAFKPDVVHYFTMDADTSTSVFDDDGTNEQPSRLYHTYAEGQYAYGVFLGGDNPLMVCKNNDGNGKKIAVVKESYGNAFCPYIALTYSETHMIDFRYIEFDFVKYLKDNGIDEVIFINNTMASASYPRVEELNALVK